MVVVFIPTQPEGKIRRCCQHLVQLHSFIWSISAPELSNHGSLIPWKCQAQTRRCGEDKHQVRSSLSPPGVNGPRFLCNLPKSMKKKSNRSVVRVFYIFQGLRCLVPCNPQLYQAVIITLISQMRKPRLREV